MAKLYPISTAHNHDEIYAKIGESGVTDHGLLTGLSDDDHPQYLLTTGTAADSDKLDNIDSTGFVQTSGNQTVGGIKTFTSIPALPATNPTTANQAVRKGFADATYLGISAKAADSDKLDGLDSTDFGRPVFLASPLTSTTWNMSSPKSSASPTLIDMSVSFANYPATPPKALMVRLIARDSVAVHRTDLFAAFGPSVSRFYQLSVHPAGGDIQTGTGGIINCDANGDIAYSLVASGTNTMDVQLEIWGYWL